MLHVFDHSLPLQSGYTFRSMAILRAQRERGWQTLQVTSPRHEKALPSKALSDEVDGFTFWRTPAPRQHLLSRTLLWPLAETAATARRLAELAAAERPDIIHAHSPSLNAHPAIRVGRDLGIPVVYEVRGLWEDAAVDHGTSREGDLRYRLTRWHETAALRKAHHVVTICEGLRTEIVARGIPPSRLSVVPNAVDVDRFQPVQDRDSALAERLGLAGKWVVGFCGSFYGYEGLDLILRALPMLVRRIPDLRLLLVGGGPEDKALRSLVGELRLSERVVMPGRVPNQEIGAYYSLIDVLVFPRKRMRLTELVTPLKPLEAMAMGLPVLASNVGGHRELIRHGDTGMLFAADDAAALAAAVTDLHGNEPLLAALRDNGRGFVQRERTWARSAAVYEAAYEAARAAAGTRTSLAVSP